MSEPYKVTADDLLYAEEFARELTEECEADELSRLFIDQCNHDDGE